MRDGYENLVQDGDEEYVPEPRWWSPSAVLTDGSAAIAAFTLAVVGTMGFVGRPVAEALVGLPERPGDLDEHAVVSAMIVLLLLLGALWLSQGVLLDEDEAAPAWGRNLAGASVVIAAIGATLSVVTIVASLVAPA